MNYKQMFSHAHGSFIDLQSKTAQTNTTYERSSTVRDWQFAKIFRLYIQKIGNYTFLMEIFQTDEWLDG